MAMADSDLRWFLMVGCGVVFAAVFAVMLGALWLHHRRGSRNATNFHGSFAVELCWALAPMIVVVLLVWPTARLFFKA